MAPTLNESASSDSRWHGEPTFSAQCEIRGCFVRFDFNEHDLPCVDVGGLSRLGTRGDREELLRIQVTGFVELFESLKLETGHKVRLTAHIVTYPDAPDCCPTSLDPPPDLYADTVATNIMPEDEEPAFAVWTPEGKVSAVLDGSVVVEGKEAIQEWADDLFEEYFESPGLRVPTDVSPLNAALCDLLAKLD